MVKHNFRAGDGASIRMPEGLLELVVLDYDIRRNHTYAELATMLGEERQRRVLRSDAVWRPHPDLAIHIRKDPIAARFNKLSLRLMLPQLRPDGLYAITYGDAGDVGLLGYPQQVYSLKDRAVERYIATGERGADLLPQSRR